MKLHRDLVARVKEEKFTNSDKFIEKGYTGEIQKREIGSDLKSKKINKWEKDSINRPGVEKNLWEETFKWKWRFYKRAWKISFASKKNNDYLYHLPWSMTK